VKNSLKRAVSLILAAGMALCTTGCWDRIEINERIFVLALAVDKFQPGRDAQDGEGGGQQEEGIQEPKDSPRNRMVVSIVFPNVGLLKGEGAIVPEEAKFAMSTVAPSIFEAVRQFNTRINGNIFFAHVKAVLVGEELVKDEKLFLEVLDELERDHEIARNIDFVIVKGDAKEALYITPLVEPVIGTYIEQIFRQRKTGRFHAKNLGKIITSIRETGGALVPRMIVGENEFKIAGSCVIKDYKHRAWLGELETRAAQWMDNMAGEGVITVYMSGVAVPFELTGLKRRMRVWRNDQGSLNLDIMLEGEGNIAGHILEVHRGVMDEGLVREMERAVERDMEAQCTVVMDKFQHEFGIDIWGIGDYIRKFRPEIWEDVKDNWKEAFPEMRINISADIEVRRIGIIK
jgi:spore germination protein KC